MRGAENDVKELERNYNMDREKKRYERIKKVSVKGKI